MKAVLEKLSGDERADGQLFARAGEIIRAGGLVAFPTETVYGLGANALDPEASKKIYEAKGRPSDNPLIVHIADMADLYRAAVNVPREAEMLAGRLWPGPLTMILEKSPDIPYETTGGLDTVAVRFPSNECAQRLIKASGCLIAAPSANISGRPSPTKAEHVLEDLGGRIDMIIDGGNSVIGLESTIVDLTVPQPAILRPGYYNSETIREVIGEVCLPDTAAGKDDTAAPKAPGMKYRHYAPKGELVIAQGEGEDLTELINSASLAKKAEGFKTAVICRRENAENYTADVIYVLGSGEKEEELAAALFDTLRKTADDGVDYIISESFYTPKLGGAIMNRLTKAAGGQILKHKGEEK